MSENSDIKLWKNIKAGDEQSYEFCHSVETIDENDNGGELAGSFIPVTTYNPTSNINNGALGYFSAQSIMRYTMRISD